MKGKAARKVAKEQAELTPRAAAVLLVSGKLPEVATSINGDVIRLDGAREIERRLNAFAEYRRWALHVLKKGQETGTAFLLREAGRVAAVCDEASCCDLANSVRLILPAIEDEDFERASDLERKILSNPEARSWFGVIRAIEIALSVRIVPAYNPAPMGDAAHDLNALAANLGYTFESAKVILERGAVTTPREPTGRATGEPRPVSAKVEATARVRGKPRLTTVRRKAAYDDLKQDWLNPALSANERRLLAKNLVKTYNRVRERDPDYHDDSEQLTAARSMLNKANYQRRKAKAAGMAITL